MLHNTKIKMRSRSNSDSLNRLDYYHRLVSKTILDFQHPVTGFLPASLFQAKFDGFQENTGDAWVRDNVYGILAVWGLSLAYRKNADVDDDRSKAYELEQSVVKLMRGLLMAMMQQTEKVENFKKTQSLFDSLHAKYNYTTGLKVVEDRDWGHLQLDATSLYLLMLAQMTAAGLQIVYTYDEVAFVQNLVFYIETAYRTPDYGIWERGDKTNHGYPELNTSSVGMAKAAMEALSELDLFGAKGGPRSVIHVQADQIQFCKAILHSMLPKESNSKEIGASLLSIISYPAFAVEDKALVQITKAEIIGRLEGKYGCCRFLRDGHKTAKEDPKRLHYEPAELRIFDNIECEWPLFFIYLILDGIYNGNYEQAEDYKTKLDSLLLYTSDGLCLVPELFTVPADKVELEYSSPHSQERVCGDHVPHIWSQSLYILASLLYEGYVAVGELDPLNRRYSTAPRPDLVVQVALIAEDENIQQLLNDNDVPCQSQQQAAPLRILPAKCLSRVYSLLGRNAKMKLSGRPLQNIGLIGTGSLYRADGTILAFTPQFLDYQQFYLCLDNELLVDAFKTEVEYLRSNWNMLGRPTITIPLTHAIIEDSMKSSVGNFIMKVRSGYFHGVRVRVGLLSELLSTSCVQMLDFLQPSDLEDLLMEYPDPIVSPRPGDVLKNPAYEDEDSERRHRSRHRHHTDPESRASFHGAVMRSRSLSRAASWGTDETEDDEHLAPIPFNPAEGRPVSPFDGKEMNDDDLKEHLEKTDDILEQADILHYLYTNKGPHYDVKLHGIMGHTVLSLLADLYEKASHHKMWSLIRYTSGMLHKQVDNLGEAATDLLVRQKQISVGLPHMDREEVIMSPLPPKELKRLIYRACGEDRSLAVLTQELLVYLSMLVKTQPSLFNEMLRLRVGLITEVMVTEYGRVSGLSNEIGADDFMNLSPFQMKSLLFHILSGKEFSVKKDGSNINIVGAQGKGSINKMKRAVKKLSRVVLEEDSSGDETSELSQPKIGQWLRRRCLDGALNRVPMDFYPKIWRIIAKCQGVSIAGHVLQHSMVQEMTPGEMKFALSVETALNRIPHPEYRQLLVEAFMVLSMVMENEENLFVNHVVPMDEIVLDSNKRFLQDQVGCGGDATLCCAGSNPEQFPCGCINGICKVFFDSAPSGGHGTMAYFARTIVQRFCAVDGDDAANLCKVS